LGNEKNCRERRERIKRKAFDVLSNSDFAEIYKDAEINKDSATDVAIKAILAEKLVDSISGAKKYAKKTNLKRIGASAVLISEENL
jgi:hypothetical protein